MRTTVTAERDWSVARFPSRSSLEAFRCRVRLWNRVERLPAIEIRPLPDGRRVRIRSVQRRVADRLVDALGGWIAPGDA
jgi:hypothetical protein